MTERVRSAQGDEWLDGLEIGTLGPADAEEVLGVLVCGMRDNPVHIAVFGDDPRRRQERLLRVFEGAFGAMGWQANMLAARGPDGTILGVCGALPPGGCRLGPASQQGTCAGSAPGPGGTPMSATGTWDRSRSIRTFSAGASARG